jgi:UDP-glucose 4-epimerase
MIKITGAKSTVQFVPQEKIYGTSYEDIPRRVPDNTKMKTILKTTMDVSLEDGLRKTIDWFQKAHFDAAKAPSHTL